MSLTVQRVTVNDDSRNRKKSHSQNAQATANVPMTAHRQVVKSKYVDKSCDGKFSFWEATKNFGKGLISPITGLFSSKKNFLIGAGMIVGSAVLIAATGGAAAPFLIGAGVAMGTLQAGNGVYKIVKAKNGDDIEKACYDFGGATGTIGLSMLGAKSSLKQAGIKTEGLNVLSATGKCITSSKSMAIESYGVFKSGYYKTNLSNTYKSLTTSKNLRQYSKELYKHGEEKATETFSLFENILPKKFKSKFTCRNKCELSIYEKMVKEMTTVIDENIKDIKADKLLTPEVKKLKIAKQEESRLKIKNDPEFAKGKVEDVFGGRMALDTPEEIIEFVSLLSRNAKKGKTKILEIESYRGKNDKFVGENEHYYSVAQAEKMKKATGGNCKVTFKDKKSGYTGVNMKIQVENGEVIELQVSLKDVRKVGDLEHPPYDLSMGKDLAKGNNQMGMIFQKVKTAIGKLTPEQKSAYNKYYYDHYINAQAKEYGKPFVTPKLPEGLPEVLSVESVEALLKLAHKIPQGAQKTPQNGLAQLSFIYGYANLMEKENN